MATRVKVTYVAMDEYKPIITASTFEELRAGLDDYFGVGWPGSDSLCMGFIPYETKYPDTYEGHYTYSYTTKDTRTGLIKTELEVIKVYCVDYHPHTVYEI
jgi:hypothetical protein